MNNRPNWTHVGLLGVLAAVVTLGGMSLSLPSFLDDDTEWNYLATLPNNHSSPRLDCFGYFRPIKNLLFRLGAPLREGQLAPAHLLSLLFCVLLLLLSWRVAQRLMNDERWAVVTAAVFMLAPTQLTIWTWFSCTTNIVFMTVMVLATLLTADRASRRRQEGDMRAATGYSVLALCSAGLALLSYEEAVVLPLLFLLWQYARQRPLLTRPTISMTMMLGGAVIGYLAVRTHFQGITSAESSGFFPPLRNTEVSAAAAYFTLHHLSLWLWPWQRLTLFAGYPLPGTLPPFTFPCCWLLLGGLSLLAFRLRRGLPFVWIGWLWFLIAFLPMSNLVPLRNGPLADYYLVLPGFGLALALSSLLQQLWSHRRSATGAARPLLTFACSALALSRIGAAAELPRGVRAWRHPLTLYSYHLRADPMNYIMMANYGNSLLQEKQFAKAQQLADAAKQLAPWFGYAFQLEGEIAMRCTNYPVALQYFAQAQRINPESSYPLKAQGFIMESQGQPEKAAAFFQQALEKRWKGDSVEVALRLSKILTTLGRTDEARSIFNQARQHAPRHPDVLREEARLQKSAGNQRSTL